MNSGTEREIQHHTPARVLGDWAFIAEPQCCWILSNYGYLSLFWQCWGFITYMILAVLRSGLSCPAVCFWRLESPLFSEERSWFSVEHSWYPSFVPGPLPEWLGKWQHIAWQRQDYVGNGCPANARMLVLVATWLLALITQHGWIPLTAPARFSFLYPNREPVEMFYLWHLHPYAKCE